MNVAIFIFDDIQILDFTGPMDVFSTKPQDFNTYTVGSSKKAITTYGGLSVNPSYSFENAPKPDLLIIPGGNVRAELEKEEVIRWIQETSRDAKHVLSICTGSFLIAKAGLLDGLTTTTYHRAIDRMKSFSSAYTVVADQRFVDNGKIWSSAGISSGIDASFQLISKIKGLGEAQDIALILEYDWHPNGNYVRAALADLELPELNLPGDTKMTLAKTEGDRNNWLMEGLLHTNLPQEKIISILQEQLEKGGFEAIQKVVQNGKTNFRWTKPSTGKPWVGSLSIVQASEKSYQFSLAQSKTQ